MPLEDEQIKRLILDLLKTESERDGQRMIGASEIGNPCDYCLGNRLLNKKRAPNRYWMGARIGTAIHEALEEQERIASTDPSGQISYKFEALEGSLIEQKITLGTIEGYGTVRSKPDLVLVNHAHLIDHKTTTRDKIKRYKLDGVSQQYIYQQQLYAWGLNKAGIKIDRISLSFIARDGLTDDDVWVYSFDYDEATALKAWDRLTLIWKYLEAGNDVETLESHPDCYTCNTTNRM